MSTPHHQVSFMPWAGLEKEMKVGRITFWPFSKQARDRVADETIREHLERYFRCYVDHQGRPVSTVTICSHGAADFRQLPQDEAGETRAAVDALIFSIICPATKAAVCANNNSMGPPSAERYQLIAQNFRPGDHHIAVQAGSVLSGGWSMGQISFPKPWSTGGAFASPDSRLLEGFSKFFESKFTGEVKERVLRSLEWFRFAHIESDEISPLSKVVMMATIFEIVLDVPNVRDKSGWIADEVAKRCSRTESFLETRKDNKGSDVTRPKIGWWAWDFYKLRNAIVHGDAIKSDQLRYHGPQRDWLSQLIVADLVFWECVTRELYAHNCLGEEVREYSAKLDEMFPDEPPGSAEPDALAGFVGFDFDGVHRALGWLPELQGAQ